MGELRAVSIFRFFAGIVLVQVVTLALFFVNQGAGVYNLLLLSAFPALVVAGVTSLWFFTIGRMDTERRSASLRESHASERSKLHRKIERTRSQMQQKASADKAQMQEQAFSERERLVQQTHRQLMRRERSISRRANLKVGLSFIVVTGLGVLMLITEMLTLGLLTITTAGGALGGYVLRWRQSHKARDRLSGAISANEKALEAQRNDGVDARGKAKKVRESGKQGVDQSVDTGRSLPAIEGTVLGRGSAKSG